MKRYVPNAISAALLIAAFLMYWNQDQVLALYTAIVSFAMLGATLIWRWYRTRGLK